MIRQGGTVTIGNIAGQLITSGISDAINGGFDGGNSFTPNNGGFTYYFNLDPNGRRIASDQDSLQRFLAAPDGGARPVDEDFSALGYAGSIKAPPTDPPRPHDWLGWFEMRGTKYDRSATGSDLNGEQHNVTAGLTRRLSPDFLVGVFGGYEYFDYSSQALTSMLKGHAWTAGTYFGWRLSPNLRFGVAGAWSKVLTNSLAGTASGNFAGNRWLVSGSLAGTYRWQGFVLEPSAQVFTLWEHDNAFTDSLGTEQTGQNFTTVRTSGGVEVSYPFAWQSALNLSPYTGIYSDYYFSRNDQLAAGLTSVPLLQGFAPRVTAGVTATFASRAQLSAGGEYEWIDANTHILSWRVRGGVPF